VVAVMEKVRINSAQAIFIEVIIMIKNFPQDLAFEF